MIKVGKFYEAYNKDSYIISFLTGYKMKKGRENNYSTGFIETSLNRVKGILEERKINYLVLDKRHNYEVDEKIDYKDLNKYHSVYKKAKEKVSLKNRLDLVYETLNSEIDNKNINEKLRKIEEIAYEK